MDIAFPKKLVTAPAFRSRKPVLEQRLGRAVTSSKKTQNVDAGPMRRPYAPGLPAGASPVRLASAAR